MPKKDEKLPVKEKFEDDEGNVTAKVRPIFPMNPASIDLMRISISMKNYMQGIFVWLANENTRLTPAILFQSYTGLSQPCFTFKYEVYPSSESLDKYVRFAIHTLGTHVIAMGDDSLICVNNVTNEEPIWIAADLKSADRSEGKHHQDNVILWMKKLGIPDDLCKIHDEFCSTKYEVNHDNQNPLFKIEIDEYRSWTKTGNPLTSIQNVLANLYTTLRAADDCYNGRGYFPSNQEYKDRFIRRAREYGLNVVLEPSTRLNQLSFLGGFFCDVSGSDTPTWTRLNHTKAMFFKPLTEQIYGQENPDLKHIFAITSDPTLRADPVGRAFASLRDKAKSALEYAERFGGDKFDPADIMRRYKQHLGAWDIDRLEMMTNDSIREIGDDAYFDGIYTFAVARLSLEEAQMAVIGPRELIDEIYTLGLAIFNPTVSTSARLEAWNKLRFG
jgi:hypothetical protein